MRFATLSRLLALLAVVFALPLLFAQETTAGFQGTVRDASGAVVAMLTS